MSNLTIFKNAGAVANTQLRQSALGKQIAATMGGFNRIQTNTNGTFKRIVNGEQVGKPIRGEFNAIIVSMLAKPSLEYYASAYDPDAKGTAPDCFSNLGDKPEDRVTSRQSANCATCKHRVEGSGPNGKSKACRVKRRIAIMLEGDTSGDVYQFNVPGKSLFGKGDGHTHPFEPYVRYLVANGAAPDTVVTTIAYNLDSDTMELNFTPARPITDEEYELVVAAQENPTTQRLIQITAGEADGAKAKAIAKPVTNTAAVDEDEDEVEEPVVAKPKAKKEEPAKANVKDLASVVSAWADDDEDED